MILCNFSDQLIQVVKMLDKHFLLYVDYDPQNVKSECYVNLIFI